MGNIGGVRKKGLTLKDVETAMREVLDEKFPGIFVVNGPTAEYATVSLQLVDRENENSYVLVWRDEGAGPNSVYPGLIGGNHPRMGIFGYWLLSIIAYGIANKLNTRVFDEGIGYYRQSEVRAGADPTFAEFIKKNGYESTWFLTKSFERKITPRSLWPWFDG